ncbi:gephyrin-like molybdotransferase Glp [candidate division KSB1 bacterium]
MITVEEAFDILDRNIRVLPEIKVDIASSSGYILSKNIISSDNIPFSDNSAMDGFAVISRNTENAAPENPVKLEIIGEAPAGIPFTGSLKAGQAVSIMTGGVIPQGADAVIKIEDTEDGGKYVKILKEVVPGENIRPAGEDILKNSKVLSAGEQIGPAEMGVLASIGCTEVPVYKKPRVTFLITGTELIDPDEPLIPGKVRNSNFYSLSGLLETCNVDSVNLGRCGDSLESIKNWLDQGREADIIITTGAVSMGKYDFIRDAFGELGGKQLFWKVAQRPGKPLFFGNLKGIPVFGLPGNPVSVMVSFLIYVKRALYRMQNRNTEYPDWLKAELIKEYKKVKDLTYFARGIYSQKNNSLVVESVEKQGSGMLSSMHQGNCLIKFNSGTNKVLPDEIVDILILK